MFRLRCLVRCAAAAAPLVGTAATVGLEKLSPQSKAILGYPYEVVSTPDKLAETVESLRQSKSFALDIEAFCATKDVETMQLGQISLIQVCTTARPVVSIIDVLTLGTAAVVASLRGVMEDPSIRKMLFDCRRDVEALSYQLKLKPAGVLDLQLFHTAVQWKLRSVNRRSSMNHVLKLTTGVLRQHEDSAVHAAMTLGNRPVWDVRPLPGHFLDYAADDVRNTLVLSEALLSQHSERVDAVERLTAQYVEHYTVERPVEIEADPKAADVRMEWLERFLGPGGKCAFCGQKGHVEAECFRKQGGMKCTHCGESGHIAKNCFKKFPQLLKCDKCGQLGHTGAKCFHRNPCKHCGGPHASDNCHNNRRR
jgi:hypothetical protein